MFTIKEAKSFLAKENGLRCGIVKDFHDTLLGIQRKDIEKKGPPPIINLPQINYFGAARYEMLKEVEAGGEVVASRAVVREALGKGAEIQLRGGVALVGGTWD